MSGAICESYAVEAGAFGTAGEASGKIKGVLRKLGVPSALIRRVAVASYEVELNLVIHSLGGTIDLSVEPGSVVLDVADRGPGIPDLALAMQEGWSTASDEVRMLGFGAGMGLPNMKRNADEFAIQSEMGVGTRIHMRFRSPEGTES